MNIEAINASLESFGLNSVSSVGLTVSEKAVSLAEEVMAEFIAFGGSGWLLTAGVPTPWINNDISEARDQWPEEGERCAGSRSLRLQRAPGGWCLTVIEEAPRGDMVMREAEHLGSGAPGSLRYGVYYREVVVGSHRELRPYTCRFLGFGKGAKDHA
jgi:hypothetical protein